MGKGNKTTIYLARHASVKNPKNIIYGFLPFELTSTGRSQSRKLGKFLKNKKISKIYSSPLVRAKQTAEIARDVIDPNMKVIITNGLRETEWTKEWQGKKRHEIKIWKQYIRNVKSLKIRGLTAKDIGKRVYNELKRIIKKNKGENVLCVSHGDPIKFCVTYLMDPSFSKFPKYWIRKGNCFKLIFNGYHLKKFKNLNIN